MGQYQVTGPDGGEYQFEAGSDEEAAAAVDELFSTTGGGQAPQGPSQPDPSAVRDQFSGAFDPSQDSAPTAQGLDQRLNGEADSRGRWATAGNALTMGFGDEALGVLAGGLTFVQGEGFDKGYNAITQGVRKDIANYADRNPVEHAAIDIAGSLPTAMIPGTQAVRGASLGAKVLRGAVAGAGYGAARGYGEGEGGVQNRLEGAAVGGAVAAGIGGAVPVVGAGIGRAVGKKAGRATVPTAKQYEDAGGALYKTADDAGVIVSPVATDRLRTIRQEVSSIFTDANASAESFKELYPKTVAALGVVDGLTERGLTLRNVEEYRKVLLEAVMGAKSPADAGFASRVLRKFDRWKDTIPDSEFISNGGISGAEARRLYNDARLLWKTKSRTQTIEAVVQAARDATVDQPGNSAFVAALTSKFKQLRQNEHLMAGFSDQDREFILAAAGGKRSQRVLKWLDDKSPGFSAAKTNQNVLWGLLALPAAPVAGAVGLGAKVARNRSVAKAANNAGMSARLGGAPMPFDKDAARKAETYADRLISAGTQTGGREVLDLGNIMDRGVPPRTIPAR